MNQKNCLKNFVSSLILAGGRSSRMGTDKALLTVNKQPFLSQIFTIAKKCTDEVYVLTPFTKKYQSILPSNCKFITEKNPFQGPVIAINQALPYLTTEWVLILACDLPFLSLTEVQNWLNYLSKLDTKVDAFLPRNPKGWECLCGFYRRQSLNSLDEFIYKGNFSLQKWLSGQIVEHIPIKNQQILFNCNTSQDYQQVIKVSTKGIHEFRI